MARDTWPAEIEKWDHLQMLTYSVAVGTEKERKAALMRDADIYIINRENVQWLIEQSTLPFDFDTVIVDELSSFKSHQSKRFKALIKVRPRIRRIVGLTGTPSANGLMDLWAEFKILDMGQRLGRFIGMYRNNYFAPDKRNGQIIYLSAPARCRQCDLSEDLRYHHFHESSGPPEDAGARYEQLREELSDDEAERYEELRQTLVLPAPGVDITVANAAVLSGKLLQMAAAQFTTMTDSRSGYMTKAGCSGRSD